MSAFGDWKAYAQPQQFGRFLELNIGREIAPNKWVLITKISDTGTEMKTVHETEGAAVPAEPLKIPHEAAEVLYKALDRIFGHQNQDGKVEALETALEKEQGRVDFFLQRAFGGPKRPQHKVTGEGGEGE